MKKVFNDGVFDISNAEYHASAGISRSRLLDFKKNAHNYWFHNISGLAVEEEATPAMNLGSAVHTLVLEAKKWDDEFFVTHQKIKPKKGTPPNQEMLDNAAGRIILSKEEHIQALNISTSLMNNDTAMALLSGCFIEQSIYFTHKPTGMQCKARPDAWLNGVAIDLKTAKNASHRAFQYAAMDRGYFLQAGMMFKAFESIDIEMQEFVFIVGEKEAPYSVAIYTLNQEGINYGVQLFDDLMQGLKHCLDNDRWPGYGIKELTVPKWISNDVLEEIE